MKDAIRGFMTFHPNPTHRREAWQWAQSLMNRRFYVLDTETTGLGKHDEIVQIGIVDQNGKTAMDKLIKPTISIPPGASRVHGIYDSDVENAPDFKDIYAELSKLLAGQLVIAYNMTFDRRMIQQSGDKYGLPEIRMSQHCAMRQYAQYRGQRRKGWRGYKWHRLGNAVVQEGLQVTNAHNALGDARMTLKLIQKMAEENSLMS